jgi:hypothetical protein
LPTTWFASILATKTTLRTATAAKQFELAFDYFVSTTDEESIFQSSKKELRSSYL